jgi:sugar O-acyltransferase (sialic acid O-acetyltransferase NeuD family)
MDKKKLVLVGAGGFGREISYQLSEVNRQNDLYEILGFADDTPELQGKILNHYPVLGTIQWLIDYDDEICAVICIGNSKARKTLVEKISKNPNIIFPTIIAEGVRFPQDMTFGQGCIICLSSILTVDVTVGNFAIVNLDCTIGHDAVLGDFVTLYPSVNVSGNVHIGSCTEIGTGSHIIERKTIGENTLVGAGSVVVKDIPANCTAVGNPAKPIKFY